MEGFLFLTVMTGRVVCLALHCPHLGKRKTWGGRITKQLVRDGVIVKYLAGKNSLQILVGAIVNVYLLFFTFTQWPF